MASKELIIDDDYCRAMGTYFKKQGEEMDELISEYISILQNVADKGFISGEVSKVMDSYISYVKKLNKQIGRISNSTKMQIEVFLKQIDSEDKYLF